MNSLQHFVVFGERCSGTNHAVALIEENLPLRHIPGLGWKHGPIRTKALPDPRSILVVLVVRSLPDWLRSLHLTPHQLGPALRGIPFEQFIRRRVSSIADHTCDLTPWDRRFGTPLVCEHHKGRPYANLMRLRVHKHTAWLRTLRTLPHTLLLQHENLVSDPLGSLRTLAAACNLEAPVNCSTIETYKGVARFGTFTKKAYLPLDPESAQHIASQSDSDLERTLGYDMDAELARATRPLHAPDTDTLRARMVPHLPTELVNEFDEHIGALHSRLAHLETLLAELHHYGVTLVQAFDQGRPSSNLRLGLPPRARAQIRQLQRDGLLP